MATLNNYTPARPWSGLPSLVVALLVAGAAATSVRPNTFPGAIRSVSSPDGSGARIFYRPHVDRNGGQAHPVFYEDGRGHRTRVATVTRSMGVSWSPDGQRAFLQDNWGSNVADCYVLNLSTKVVTGISLFKIVQKSRGHPTGSEIPSASHYYVHCNRWRSPNFIEGAVSGHTDSNRSHDFDHPFVYDTKTRRIHWRR